MNLNLRSVGVGYVPHRALSRMRPRYGMGLLPMLDCTADIAAGGNAIACVEENNRRQQANMAERNADERQIFLDNCNRDWALNDAQFQALSLPRPANTCDQRSYGIVPAGGYTGSPVEATIPVTYLPPPVISPAPPPVPQHDAAAQAAASKAQADAAKAQADAAAKRAAADPTNPAAQAAAEKAQADADTAAKQAASQNQAAPASDYSALYWLLGIAVVGTVIHAAVNR